VTSTATSPERRSGTLRTAGQARVALAALLAAVVIGLASLLTAPAASAAASLRPQQRVAASARVGGPFVGPHETVLPGQRRARAPSYDQHATGSSVAAEGVPTLEIDAARMPNIARNIQSAIDDGQPDLLNREADPAVIQANRAAACAGFCGPGSPDEYPFASTTQGGAGARVEGVPLAEQRIQGGVLSSFYQKFGIGQGDPFWVLVNWGDGP
jgi:hypothetical protein